MNGRIDVVYNGKICWSVLERDGKYSLECDNEMFGMKKLSKRDQQLLIEETVEAFKEEKGWTKKTI